MLVSVVFRAPWYVVVSGGMANSHHYDGDGLVVMVKTVVTRVV